MRIEAGFPHTPGTGTAFSLLSGLHSLVRLYAPQSVTGLAGVRRTTFSDLSYWSGFYNNANSVGWQSTTFLNLLQDLAGVRRTTFSDLSYWSGFYNSANSVGWQSTPLLSCEEYHSVQSCFSRPPTYYPVARKEVGWAATGGQCSHRSGEAAW